MKRHGPASWGGVTGTAGGGAPRDVTWREKTWVVGRLRLQYRRLGKAGTSADAADAAWAVRKINLQQTLHEQLGWLVCRTDSVAWPAAGVVHSKPRVPDHDPGRMMAKLIGFWPPNSETQHPFACVRLIGQHEMRLRTCVMTLDRSGAPVSWVSSTLTRLGGISVSSLVMYENF